MGSDNTQADPRKKALEEMTKHDQEIGLWDEYKTADAEPRPHVHEWGDIVLKRHEADRQDDLFKCRSCEYAYTREWWEGYEQRGRDGQRQSSG